MRRLTLRTLLAYLDDTLEPAEIKEIGEKVAESDAAQELVARLKQVTRRRRLTAPSSEGPEGVDPNDVAEYLDSELDTEKVNELEKLALASDVHLAEIAACHQILTLVLGEPALVPPKARERMYGLVRGREAIARKKAQGPKKLVREAVVEEEDLALSSGWLRWVLPAAGVALVLLLGFAIYQVLPPSKPKSDDKVAQNDKDNKSSNAGLQEKPEKTNEPIVRNDNKSSGESGKGEATEPSTTPGTPEPPPAKPAEAPVVLERAKPPSKAMTPVGVYAGGISGLPSVLVARSTDKGDWRRLTFKDPVSTNETVMALPGFSSLVQTNSGVLLLLRGHVREFATAPIMFDLAESAVVFHANDEFDLDLTLLRGRIYLTNRKDRGPAKIRLRFQKEVWDITLANPSDEVVVDLIHSFTPLIDYRKGEEPRTDCYLAVLKGDVDLKLDAYHTHNVVVEPPRWARVEWDSSSMVVRGPYKEDRLPEALTKQPLTDTFRSQLPADRRDIVRRMDTALKNLETLLGSGKKPLRDALKETHVLPDPVARVLAIYCLAAIDAVGLVLDSLGEQREGGAADREAAMFALQRWVSRGSQQAKLLYDEKTGTGLLIDKMYKPTEADRIVQLLHPFLAEDLGKEETYHFLARCLRHPKIEIAELGYWNLFWLCRGKLPGGFSATLPLPQRERYAEDIERMIEKKQIPPPPEKPMGN